MAPYRIQVGTASWFDRLSWYHLGITAATDPASKKYRYRRGKRKPKERQVFNEAPNPNPLQLILNERPFGPIAFNRSNTYEQRGGHSVHSPDYPLICCYRRCRHTGETVFDTCITPRSHSSVFTLAVTISNHRCHQIHQTSKLKDFK